MGLKEMAEATEGGELVTDASGRTIRDVHAGERVRATISHIPTEPELDPNTPADWDVPANVAWSRIMGEVQFIAKADSGKGITYNYRGVDRVVDNVAPMLRKHGVIVMPVKVRAEHTVVNTTKGAAMNYTRATVSFAVMGPRGDVLSAPHPETGIVGVLFGEAIGEGFDSGDKSSMKAQSVAYREFLIKALAIPVNRPEADPEHGEQHQIAGPRTPTAQEYMSEILSEGVTVNRLSQIKAELSGDRAKAVTTVELADGEKIRLIDLVMREGKRRVAGQ